MRSTYIHNAPCTEVGGAYGGRWASDGVHVTRQTLVDEFRRGFCTLVLFGFKVWSSSDMVHTSVECSVVSTAHTVCTSHLPHTLTCNTHSKVNSSCSNILNTYQHCEYNGKSHNHCLFPLYLLSLVLYNYTLLLLCACV